MLRIGQKHVSLDKFLNEQGEVPFRILLPGGLAQRIKLIRRIFPLLVNGYDIIASKVYVPCFIKAIEDEAGNILDDLGRLVREDGAYDAWQKTNSRVAHELMRLFADLPIIEDNGRPAMMKTKKAILTEIAHWMRETPSDDEAKELVNFFLKLQGGDYDKILEEALRQATDTAFPASRLVPLYLQASAEKRPCEVRGVVCKVLAMAIARNTNDWFLHRVFAATEPLPVDCSDGAYDLLRREAVRIAKLDADYRQLQLLLKKEPHYKESVSIEYPEAGVPIVTVVDTAGHWKKEYEADNDRLLLVYADIARNWRKEYGLSVQLRLRTFLYTGNKELVYEEETLVA